MKAGKRIQKWGVILLSILLMIAMITLPVFADGEEEEKQGFFQSLKTGEIVELIIAAVIVVLLVFFGIKYRAKVAKFFREYKSEVKRIVWFPWDQTKKSTVVVLVVLIVCALAICLLDLGLGKGIVSLIGLF